ncbi:MAG: insulinase family protein, partial [Verrucomicrobiota bacterium]
MKTPLFLLLLTPALLLGKPEAPSANAPWAHSDSDLSPDEAIQWGTLENGLRFALLQNPEPPDRVSLRLFVDAGSLMEDDDQQGLAHFLEHMAFNGTRNFPAGEMVEYFQRLGMAFGSHTNAHTSFRETVYKLELPNTEDSTLEEGFQLLRDYADGLLFGEEEIEKERGVILSEKRSRDSADWRSFVDWMDYALAGNLLSVRMPIGTEEV